MHFRVYNGLLQQANNVNNEISDDTGHQSRVKISSGFEASRLFEQGFDCIKISVYFSVVSSEKSRQGFKMRLTDIMALQQNFEARLKKQPVPWHWLIWRPWK